MRAATSRSASSASATSCSELLIMFCRCRSFIRFTSCSAAPSRALATRCESSGRKVRTVRVEMPVVESSSADTWFW